VPELGLFPLGIVLLPTERVPLHIFEPRYRELIGECLERELEFGLLFGDEEGVRPVGTLTRVVRVLQRYPDGRLNILVEGHERFRVVRETAGRSFQTAEVEPLVDDDEAAAEPEDAARAITVFKALAELAGAEVEEPDSESSRLSFELAARVELEAEAKQRLLEATSERERLKLVVELLERAVAGLALQRELQARASGNGKVGPFDVS
jgi:ATP-dependent Lon protease